jgi:hypothetical protein
MRIAGRTPTGVKSLGDLSCKAHSRSLCEPYRRGALLVVF